MKTVYILRSLSDPKRHYTGVTEDLLNRLDLHNKGKVYWSSRYRPWKVLASLSFENPNIASDFERYLKSGSGRAFMKKHFLT